MNRFSGMILIGVLMSFLVSDARAEITLAIVGDSLSDEYAEETYAYAQNWVEQLVASGIADAGPTAADAGVGDWGEPRRTGFAYNWARAGAVTQDLVSQGQVAGVVSQVASEGVTHVVAAIGANDFIPSGVNYFAIYNGLASPGQIEQGISANLAVVTTAMQTLKATGAKVVWVNVPDYGICPATRLYYPDPIKRERVTTVIREVNYRLADLARAEGIPLVDFLGLAKAVFGENAAPNPTIELAGIQLDLLASDDPVNNPNPYAAFVDDGVHPHTTVQGIMANLVLEAFNVGYGEDLPLFSEADILAHAGIPGGGEDTLFAQLDAHGYSDYIIVVPEPSVHVLLATAAAALLAFARRRRRRPRSRCDRPPKW
jgi:lysophospholipase L1-like esterase